MLIQQPIPAPSFVKKEEVDDEEIDRKPRLTAAQKGKGKPVSLPIPPLSPIESKSVLRGRGRAFMKREESDDETIAKAVRKVMREDNWLRYLERRLTGVKCSLSGKNSRDHGKSEPEVDQTRDGPDQRWTEAETEQTEQRSSGQLYMSTLSGQGNFAMQRAFGLTGDGKKRSLGAQHKRCGGDN
ncbi:hypothetical protein BD410DRAFT_810666 [Rickenella mellea]|uniref:Uncharacterized protein n=1 Tax=Rickenella mellea TaxID=50990 RepID=A0A4Y7PDK1_9AGAM|nr:hypothetical protein BD410DRAFT_810666 [Rickenella mellea]